MTTYQDRWPSPTVKVERVAEHEGGGVYEGDLNDEHPICLALSPEAYAALLGPAELWLTISAEEPA